MPHLTIDENSRTFIAGQNGSGKTVFAVELLKQVERLVVLDVKGNLLSKMNLEPESRRAWRRLYDGKPIRLQVKRWKDAKTPLTETDYYEDIFRKILIAGDCMLYIDELLVITNGSQDMRPNLKELYVVGREPVFIEGKFAGGNIGIVASCQRPANVPLFALTESRNFAVFMLINPDDRDKLAGYMGEVVRDVVPDEHGFYWRSADMRDPVYYAGLPNIEPDGA